MADGANARDHVIRWRQQNLSSQALEKRAARENNRMATLNQRNETVRALNSFQLSVALYVGGEIPLSKKS